MRIAKTFAGVAAFILLAASYCLACDCMTLSEAESFEKADAVVVGEVIRTEPRGDHVAAFVRVERLFKGEPMTELVITNALSDCDAYLYVGLKYIVYAQKSRGDYFASSCLRTRAIDKQPRKFTAVYSNSAPPTDRRRIIIVTILSVTGFALLGLLLKKLRVRGMGKG